MTLNIFIVIIIIVTTFSYTTNNVGLPVSETEGEFVLRLHNFGRKIFNKEVQANIRCTMTKYKLQLILL